MRVCIERSLVGRKGGASGANVSAIATALVPRQLIRSRDRRVHAKAVERVRCRFRNETAGVVLVLFGITQGWRLDTRYT